MRALARLAVVTSLVMIALAGAATPASAVGPGGGCLGCVTTKYYVDDIYGHYNGYYDYSTGYGCAGPCQATWSETMGYSNTWGANIGFKKDPIQAQVSFSVTYSSSKAFSASFAVPAGKTGVVRYKDWYHVTQMHIHTVTCGKTCSTKYGLGWASQWYQRIFYISLT